MGTLERKISKMKVLNDSAIANLYIAEMLMKDKTLSLDSAISTNIKQNSLVEPSTYPLNSLHNRATSIAKILDKFDKSIFDIIRIRRKKNDSTSEILEEPLLKVGKEITDDYYGILSLIKGKRDDQSKSADFYKVLYDIEKSYKTILNIVKRITNKWYRFITAKGLITTFVILTIVSLITFFIINIDFHKEQTPTETILITVQESVQDIKATSNDKSLTFGEKISAISDLITKTIGIIPVLSLLLTTVIAILRLFFIKNKRTSRKLLRFADKLDELNKIIKKDG